MTPKFWLILQFATCTTVLEFSDRATLNECLDNLGDDVIQLEVISGFSLAKRRRDGK